MSEGSRYDGIGVAVPAVDAFGIGSPILEVAREAERAGLDHVWAPDHLLFHRPITEALTGLAACAGATERVKLGFAILNPTLRPAVLLAKQLGTISQLAPDRLMMGVGIGGEYEPEFRAAGVEKKTRGKRCDEILGLLPRLLAGEQVQHDGLEQIDCDGLAPAVPMPPVLVGGRGEVALKRTVRAGDAWFPMWLSPSEIAEARGQMETLAAEAGRADVPGTALVAFVNVNEDIEEGRKQAAEMVERQYAMPFKIVEKHTLLGGPEQIAARLREYRDSGVTGFCLSMAHPEPVAQIDPIAAVREAYRN